MDKIKIENLELFANHGVFPEENVLGQKFIISATLYTNLCEAGKTDDLNMSVNYGEVCHFIKEFVENNTFKLLEAVIENLAEKLLLKYSALSNVCLEVKKPWAPIGIPIETVSVIIERQWHCAYIAFGSNMGDREANIRFAITELNCEKSCCVEKESSFIKTEPYGYLEQDEFLNGCLKLKTLLTPFELLKLLQNIEKKAMRERTVHWGPRTLDLDIIFYDDVAIAHEDLKIPHIDMCNRSFVLEPLNEIAPYAIHPINRKTVAELLKELNKSNALQPNSSMHNPAFT